jgi:hypothetical protein
MIVACVLAFGVLSSRGRASRACCLNFAGGIATRRRWSFVPPTRGTGIRLTTTCVRRIVVRGVRV